MTTPKHEISMSCRFSVDRQKPKALHLDTRIAHKLGDEIIMAQEKFLRMSIRPKPKWAPKWLWRMVLNRMIRMDVFREGWARTETCEKIHAPNGSEI